MRFKITLSFIFLFFLLTSFYFFLKEEIDSSPLLKILYSLLILSFCLSCYFVVLFYKKAEKKMVKRTIQLMEAQERFRLLTEHALVGVYLFQGGVFRYVNPKFAELFGYKREEIIDRMSPYELVYPPDREIVERRIKERLSGKTSWSHYTFRGLRKDGSIIHCEVLGTVVEFRGRPAIIGTILDITERIRKRRELEALYEISSILNIETDLQKVLQTIVEKTSEIMDVPYASIRLYDKDKKMLITHAIKGMGKEYMKYRKRIPIDDLKNVSVRAFIEKKPKYARDVRKIGFSKEVLENVIERYHLRSCLSIPIVVKDEALGVMNLITKVEREFTEDEIGFLMNIAEHAGFAIMRAELYKKLEESESMYKTLFEHSGSAVAVLEKGKIILVNSMFEKLSGYRKEEVEGKKRFSEFVEEFEKCPKMCESIFRRKDGKKLSVYLTIADIPGKDRCIVSLIDITERKVLEERIREVEKMEAIGLLAGGIAHDINNILTVIEGNVELLSNEIKNTPARKYLEEICKAERMGAKLVRQLLFFSKEHPVRIVELNINTVIKNMEQMISRILGEDIELILELSPELYNIKADRSNIEQIVINLIMNARDAMPEGGKVWIASENVNVGGKRCVVLKVRDNGVGMDRRVKERIFEPFFTTKKKGTGLGLSVVYGIVKSHGGWIEVDSEKGKGTEFRLYFPAIKRRKIRRRKKRKERIEGRGEIILLVEDEPAVRETTAKLLERHGYIVIPAGSMKEAIDAFEKNKDKIELVFTDVVLPDGRGTKLVQEITKKRRVKVLFTSGYANTKIDWPEIEKYSYIPKPYSISQLLEKIKDVMHG